jgi:hypothetical protein
MSVLYTSVDTLKEKMDEWKDEEKDFQVSSGIKL